jgi:diguanylate cyclase (GGDEF)-like protein
VYVEVGSSAYFGDDLDVLLLRLRPYDAQHDLERFLTGLGSSADLEDNLGALVRSVDHLVQETESAIAYEWDGDAFSAAVTHTLPEALTAVGVPCPGRAAPLPWAQCRETGETVHASVCDLPEPVQAAAIERGLVACWALPVATIPEGSVAASLLVWRRVPFPLQIGHIEGLRRACQAAALAFARRRTERLLVQAATVDPLTGIPNRAQFFEQLEHAVEDAEPGSVAVLYLDLDRFKPVNDIHGHRFGDRVLAQVASLLVANIRPGDFIARLGGDEFAVLCRDIDDCWEATAVADRLVEVVATPIILDGTRVRIGVSIGVALAKVHGNTHDAVLDAADRALYDAKRAGRGRWKLAAVS